MVEVEKEIEEIKAEIEKPNSVEFSINAKGNYSGKCKCYDETITGAFDAAKKTAEEIEILIEKKNKESE